MALSALIGDLVVRITGDTSDLDRAHKEAIKSTEALGRSIGANIASITKWGIAAAVAGAGTATWLVKQSLDAIDAQSKLARQLNSSVAGVQALQHAANLAGVSADSLKNSIQQLNIKLGEAARTGQGPTYEALRRIGLSANDLVKLDADQKIALIADKLDKLGISSSGAADLLRSLGIRSRDFITIIEEGGEPIRRAREELKALGVIVSDVDAKQIEEANDAWTRVRAAITGIANQIAVALSPVLRKVAEDLVQAGKDGQGFGTYVDKGVRMALVALAAVQKAIYDIRIAWDEFGKVEIKFQTPEWLQNLGVAKKEITLLSTGAGTLRNELAKPPSAEEWITWYNELSSRYRKEAEEFVAGNEKKKANSRELGRVLTEEERKRYAEKLARLMQSIESEDEALKIQQERQIRQLQELQKVGLVNQQMFNDIKLKIEEKHQDSMRELIQSKLEQGILTEDEILKRKYEKQLKDLAEFEKNKTITTERAADLRNRITEKYGIDQMQLTASQYSGLANIVDTSLSHITQIMGEQGGKQFTIMKALSMATAAVKGVEATISAYAAGNKIGGPVVGGIFAGIAAAGAAALIAKLAGMGPNSGGGGAAAVPTASTPAATAAAPTESAGGPPNERVLRITGMTSSEIFGGERVRDIAEMLLKYQEDGGKVVFSR